MTLPSQKYPNQIRTVSGTPTIEPSDVVLDCDTTSAPVIINLLEIPAGYWSSQYRLYINDSAGNAGTNNITINAGAGQTINGAASVVISTDDGSATIQIVDNAKYQCLFGYNSYAPTDTGWLDLQGFAFMSAGIRPQYRVIGKEIVFRRSLVVPLEKGGSNVPYTGSSSYEGETLIAPSSAAVEGVITNSAGSITFNNGNPVLQSASHYPDATYVSSLVIGGQRREAAAPVGGDYLAYYTAPFLITIDTSGVMRLITLKNIEEGSSGQQIGQSNLRYLVSKTIAGQRISDYRDIVDSGAAASTLIGRSNVGTPNDAAFVGLNTDSANHLITHDPSEETDIGGYNVPLMNFKAFLT